MKKTKFLEVITTKISLTHDGADYRSIPAWDGGKIYKDKNILNTGIVRGNDFNSSFSEELRTVKWSIDYDPLNFLLLHTTGRLIAWKFEDESYFDENGLAENSEAFDWHHEKCIDAIKMFLKKRFSGEYNLEKRFYKNDISKAKLDLLIPEFNEISKEVIAYLSNNPKMLYNLHWRKFEELLAEIFQRKGFETEIGPGSNDGGVDLRLIQRSDIGDMLILVQAKRYAKHRRISLEPIKALWASVEEEQANKGILVTTSEFEPVAKRFADRHPFRIELAGNNKLIQWINEIS